MNFKTTTLALTLVAFFSSMLAFGQSAESDSVVSYIKAESIGGKLDFDKILREKQSGMTLFVHDETMYSHKDYSILLWGQAVKRLGVKNSKEAKKLWEEIHQEKMTKPEKKALTTGFKMQME